MKRMFTIMAGMLLAMLAAPAWADTDAISVGTFADLKAQDVDALVEFTVPDGVYVVAAGGTDGSNAYVYLWDGENGLKLEGTHVFTTVLADGVASAGLVGKKVSGSITGYYGGRMGNDNAIAAYIDISTNSVALAFAEEGTLPAPKLVTVADLEAHHKQGVDSWANAYVTVHGTMAQEQYYRYFVDDNGDRMEFDDPHNYTVDGAFKTAFKGESGNITGIVYDPYYANKINIVSTDYFVDDATLAAGIDAVHSSQFIVHSDAPAYNLAGQRVSAQYKGVVIQNGVKVIRKK